MNDLSVERRDYRHSLGMLRTNRPSKNPLLCTAMVSLAFGSGLGGCHARTDLADVTDGGEGPTGGTSSQQSGGSTSGGTAPSQGGSDAGGTAGTNPSSGGSGGTGNVAGSPAGGGAGNGGQCFEPTVDSFCRHFPCPARDNGNSFQNVLDFYEPKGVCDEFPIVVDYDTCGAEIFRFDDGYRAETFLYITGTLGATAVSGDEPFGPCYLSHYYGGIELDEFYEEYGCTVVNRCLACGPLAPDDPQYPPCRADCDCINVEIGADPCFGPETCECYCFQGLPKPE
jgi:hypothetical protein